MRILPFNNRVAAAAYPLGGPKKGFPMSHSFEFVRLGVDSRVAWLEFSRAPVNAFSREMVEKVREAIATTLTDPAVRVLMLASSIDGYFSAGAETSCIRWDEGARYAGMGLAWP